MGGWGFVLVCFFFFFFFFLFSPWNFKWSGPSPLPMQGNAIYLLCNAWNCSPEYKHVRKGEMRIHILPIIYKFNLMGQISEKCVGLKAYKSPPGFLA